MQTEWKVTKQVNRRDLDLLMTVLKQSVTSCQELVQARKWNICIIKILELRKFTGI
jgi:hypothetical protein